MNEFVVVFFVIASGLGFYGLMMLIKWLMGFLEATSSEVL